MDLWWLRMVMWARRRPSRTFMLGAAAALALAAVVVGIEAAGLWPEWASADRIGRRGPAINATPVE